MANELSAPSSLMVLNARAGGTSSFILEGAGFDGTTTVTITDLNSTAANRYQFNAAVTVLTPKRLLVTATCTAQGAVKSPQANIDFATTTGGVTRTTGAVAVILQTRRQLVLEHGRMARQKVRLEVGTKSVIFLPVTGFGDLITPSITLDKGTWTVVKTTQQPNRVKVTLRCTAVPVAGGPLGGGIPTVTGTIAVTLTSEDNTTIELPPIEVVYTVPDPAEDPDN